MTSIIRKNKVDGLINMMSPKGVKASTSQDAKENNVRNVEERIIMRLRLMVVGGNVVMNLVHLKTQKIKVSFD